MSRKSKEIQINSILDHINDQSFFIKHKNSLSTLAKDPTIIEIIEEKVSEGKRYSLIKLIDKLKIEIDCTLFLNFFTYPENINLQIYYMLFNLYVKELISIETLNKIRAKFVNVKDFERKLKNTESRCILKRIEIDRYLMKKERMQNEKVKSYDEHMISIYHNGIKMTRDEFDGVSGICMFPKISYLVDLTEFFNLNRECESEDLIFKKIGYISSKYFSKPEHHNINISTLDSDLLNNSANMKNKSADYGDKLAYWTKYIVDNFQECHKNGKFGEKMNFINERYKSKFINLKRAVLLLQEKGHSVYFLSEVNLKYFLSELLVFRSDYIDIKNIISYRDHRIGDICDEIKDKENADMIFLFGCTTKIERGYLHIIENVEKLNEFAGNAIRVKISYDE